jgi:hypothetical protein
MTIYKELNTMDIIKGVIDKVASRKLAVTAAAGAAAATGAVEITLPVAIVAAAYIIGRGVVTPLICST